MARARMSHTADVKNLIDDLGEYRPTFVLAVPRVFEKIYNSAEATAEAGGKGKIFRAAADTAVAWSRAQDAGGPGVALRVRHALFDRLVYSKLRARLGGQVQHAVSGGAPLGERLGHFFRGVGVTILEGWGLTETTAPATVNTPDLIRIGSVGRPLPGVAVRVGDDGELLVKGINVLRGYHDNPEATAEALEDGWFHTGDGGSLDDGGYLTISDRKKDVIITGGENVSSIEVEDAVFSHPAVAEVAVIGIPDEKWGELVTAMVVLAEGRTATAEEIIAHTRTRLAGYKAPKRVEFRDELARTATGKIQKFKLREPFWTDTGGRQVN